MPFVIPWWIWVGGGSAATAWLFSKSTSQAPAGIDNGVAVNFTPGGLAVVAGGLALAAYLVSKK